MLWKTHIRITRTVLERLQIQLTSEDFSRLKEGLLSPDKWQNYPHHYGKDDDIIMFLNLARANFLEDDFSNAYFNLGVALHYIQDSYTTYPSYLPKHEVWEEWIENSALVSDVGEAIRKTVKNQMVMGRCLWLAQVLSMDVHGRDETLGKATLNGMLKDNKTIASPKADLNLGYIASYAVIKSVLGPKMAPSLNDALMSNLHHFEGLLRTAEGRSSGEIIGLMSKRNERTKGLKSSSGVVAKIRNWIINIRIRGIDQQLAVKYQEYMRRKHLHDEAVKYHHEAHRIAIHHMGWYKFQIPEIDVNIKMELISIIEATGIYRLEEHRLRDLLVANQIPIYIVGVNEIIERDQVNRLFNSI